MNAVVEMLSVGTRVVLINKYAAEDKKHIRRKGKVVGHVIMPIPYKPNNVRAVYLIHLDEGFYAPQGDTYIQTIPVDPSMVHAIPDTCPAEKHFGRDECGCPDQPRMP